MNSWIASSSDSSAECSSELDSSVLFPFKLASITGTKGGGDGGKEGGHEKGRKCLKQWDQFITFLMILYFFFRFVYCSDTI